MFRTSSAACLLGDCVEQFERGNDSRMMQRNSRGELMTSTRRVDDINSPLLLRCIMRESFNVKQDDKCT